MVWGVGIKIPTFKIPMIIIPAKWYFDHFFVGIFGRWYYEPCRRASVGILIAIGILIAHWYFDHSLVFWSLICFEQMLALWFWKWQWKWPIENPNEHLWIRKVVAIPQSQNLSCLLDNKQSDRQQTIRSIKLVPNACFLDLCCPFLGQTSTV